MVRYKPCNRCNNTKSRRHMAANNSWAEYGTWARVFCSLKARAVMIQNQTQNCSNLCYSSIATKREMIRFTVVPPDEGHVFNDFIIRHIWIP